MGENSIQSVALPKDKEGRTYITDSMLEDDPGLAVFLNRTRNSWRRDEARCMYVLYPTVGQSQ